MRKVESLRVFHAEETQKSVISKKQIHKVTMYEKEREYGILLK